MEYPEIDLTLVSGRRPDLLARTLESFEANLFQNFRISQVFVNIDPFGGDQADQRACREIVLRHFPAASITEPKAASFGQAVKALWSQVNADYVFHLEDDWIVLEPITPERVFPLFEENVRAVSLMASDKNWNGRSLFQIGFRRVRFLGITLRKTPFNIFSTSPGFLDGIFARQSAILMNPNFDPEKQFYSGQNPALSEFAAPYRSRFMFGEEDLNVVRDIGRDWREKHGVEKQIIDGRVFWTGEKLGDDGGGGGPGR